MSDIEKPKARLENWKESGDFFYGTVYGHTGVVDGTYVRTPKVEQIDMIKKIVTTQNAEYKLGKKAE